MPRNGEISRLVYSPPNRAQWSEWRCGCGALAEAVDIFTLSEWEPVQVPGALIEACRCPRCITCGWVLDDDGRCDNLDCPLCGTLILVPDGHVVVTDPSPGPTS